jgi:hypothetical protein
MPGMTTIQLDALHKREPFIPFTIHTADGSSVTVTDPDMMIRTKGGRTIFVVTGGENFEVIDLLLVTTITSASEKPRRNGKRG